MVSINTNISSLIVQSSLNKSTSNLETALERLSTGFRINHAKDDAAGYAIASDITNKINSYMTAEDNILSGIDLLNTASETIELMTNQILRLRDIATQAQNGTYDTQSLSALNLEAENIISELERLRTSTEYNGIPLFESTTQATPTPPVTEIRTVGIEKESTSEITVTETQTAAGSTTLGTFLNFDTLKEIEVKDSTGSTVAAESFDEYNTINDLLSFARRNGLNATIRDGIITINSTTGLYLEDKTSNGVLDALGIGYSPNATVTTTVGTSTTSSGDVTYGTSKLAEITDTIGSVVNFSGTQTITVKNQNGAVQGTYGITQSTTFDDLFTFLNQHGISGDITNGVITLTSTSNYVEGSILTQLGIGRDEDITSQTVVTNATSSPILYEYEKETVEVNMSASRPAEASDVIVYYDGLVEIRGLELRVSKKEGTSIFDLIYGVSTYQDVIDLLKSIGINASMSNGIFTRDLLPGEDPSSWYGDVNFTFIHTNHYGHDVRLDNGSYWYIPTAYETTTVITTETALATEGTTLSELGLNSQYTINTTDGYYSVFDGNSTLQDVMDFLMMYSPSGAFNVELVDGSLSFDNQSAEELLEYFNIDYTLFSALGLYDITMDTVYTTEITNTTSATPFYSGSTSTIRADTTLSQLGITNTQYITISQNGTQQIITLHTSDMAGDILTSLNNYGLTASLTNGRFTFTGNENSYIVGMSSDLESVLKITSPYYTTSTNNLNSNTPSNKLTYTRTNPITASTTLSELGINTTQSIVVTRNDADKTIELDSTDTLNNLITELRRNGLTSTITNGKFHLNASDSAYINTMDTSLQTALKLTPPFSDQKEVTVSPGLGGGGVHEIVIQAGIDGSNNSRITVDTAFSFQNLQTVLDNGIESADVIEKIDELLNTTLNKQTILGASINRLESAYKAANINRTQLVSSLSTIKDADIAEESSEYLRQQILQNASATLLSTANQTSNVALALINGLGR